MKMKTAVTRTRRTLRIVELALLLGTAVFLLTGAWALHTQQDHRLDGIEEVEITSKQEKNIVSKLEEKDEVKSVDTDIKGRILNVIITVNDDVELDPAKALASVITENLEEDQNGYYDIQVFIKKSNEEDTRFPIIGYKHQDKDEFSWSKDR